MAIAYLPYTDECAAMANGIVSLAQLCTQASRQATKMIDYTLKFHDWEKPKLRIGRFLHLEPIKLLCILSSQTFKYVRKS